MVKKSFQPFTTTITTTELPPKFVETMGRLERRSSSRLHPRMLPWFLKRYREDPDGFELTADEAMEGRNPLGLFHNKLSAGLHLAPPAPSSPPAINASGCTHESCRDLKTCRYV